MKKILLLALLVSNVSFAQIAKYKAADFKLTSDVTLYEDNEYTFDTTANKYQLKSKRIVSLDKGLVIRTVIEQNYYEYSKIATDFVYEKGLLKSIIKTIDETETIEKFTYKDGKVIEKTSEGDVLTKHTYQYDAKGNLTNETVYEEDILLKKITYSNYTGVNSYFKKTVNLNNNEEESIYEEKFENGYLTDEKVIYPSNESSVYYTNDKLGNITSYTSEGKTDINNYEYDVKGNVLKSRIIQRGYFGMPDTNYFTFAKATYSNGKFNGTTNFEANFVKKFEPNSVSYQTIETLE